jgi:subtilisin family serine protease
MGIVTSHTVRPLERRHLRPAAGAIAVTLALLAPAVSQAAVARHGVIDATLQRRLATLAPTAKVKVLILLQGQPGARGKRSRATYERLLRRLASGSQATVLKAAGAPEKRFWLVNAVALRASRATILRIAKDSGVRRIELDAMGVKLNTSRQPLGTSTGNWGLAAMGVPTVWNTYGITGTGVRLGSIDTGMDPAHADLAGKVVGWRDFINGQPTPYDDVGHGTATIHLMVAGGAVPLGAAPGAEVLVAKAFDANGTADASDLIAAAQWMADPDGNPATADGPSIINNSWGMNDANDTWFHPLLKHWLALGILPVFSAGNDGPDPMSIESPAGYPDAFAVGATDKTGAVAAESSRGPVVWENRDGTGPAAGTVLVKPDVTGPGDEIDLTDDNESWVWSGTSMATAEVSGVAALVKQANPSLGPDGLRAVLTGTATDIAPAGPDPASGAGAVNAVAAVSSALTASTVPLTISLKRSGARNGRRQAVHYTVALTGATTAYKVSVDSAAWSPLSAAGAFTLQLKVGLHRIQVQGFSATGVPGPIASDTVVVDRTPPRLTWSAANHRDVKTITVAAHDPLSGVNRRTLRSSVKRVVTWTAGKRTSNLVVTVTIADLAGNRVTTTKHYPSALTSTPVVSRSVRRASDGAVVTVLRVAATSARLRAAA